MSRSTSAILVISSGRLELAQDPGPAAFVHSGQEDHNFLGFLLVEHFEQELLGLLGFEGLERGGNGGTALGLRPFLQFGQLCPEILR